MEPGQRPGELMHSSSPLVFQEIEKNPPPCVRVPVGCFFEPGAVQLFSPLLITHLYHVSLPPSVNLMLVCIYYLLVKLLYWFSSRV